MAFVLDASVAAAWVLPDEVDAFAALIQSLLTSDPAIVPVIWRYEMRNLLVMAERRGRLTPAASDAVLGILARLPISVDASADDASMTAIARRRSLTIYDSAYLELAARANLPLATLDRRLREAAKAEGIETLRPE
jgi:predicted nucleic acid-binding protein